MFSYSVHKLVDLADSAFLVFFLVTLITDYAAQFFDFRVQ